MGFEVSVNAFNGPIELLLHLIRTKKMDITRIAIAEIIDDYLEYMQHIQINIDQSGAFLHVATLLLKFKVRSLFPVEAEDDEEDSIEDLLQVMQGKYYAVIADLLDSWQNEREDFYFGGTRQSETEPFEKIEDALQDVTLLKFALIYDQMINKQIDIEEEKYLIPNAVTKITLAEQKYWLLETFQEASVSLWVVIHQFKSKLKQVITFLAILECIQEGLVIVITQDLEDPLLLFSV